MRFLPPALLALLSLMAHAALAQPFLPSCGPWLGEQISHSGCTCRHEAASQLSASPAGWRWSCDLLRGSDTPPASADSPGRPQELPPGLRYTPQGRTSRNGTAPGSQTQREATPDSDWNGY